MKKSIFVILTIALYLGGCGNKENNTTKKEHAEVIEMTSEDMDNMNSSSIDVTYRSKYKICYRSKNMGHPSKGNEYSTDCGWNNNDGSGNYIINYYVRENSVDSDYPDYNKLSDVKISKNFLKIFFLQDTNFTLLYKIDDDMYLQIEVKGYCKLNQENLKSNEDIINYYIQNGYFDQVIDFDVVYLE